MPALTHGAWQHTQAGMGLEGQLPFTGPARALAAHALKATLPTCVKHVHSTPGPFIFFNTFWPDWNVVRCFFSLVKGNMIVKALLTYQWLHLNSVFSCSVHVEELWKLRQWKMLMMVVMVINRITKMETIMKKKGNEDEDEAYAPFTFWFSEPPPKLHGYRTVVMKLCTFLYLLYTHIVVKIMSSNLKHWLLWWYNICVSYQFHIYQLQGNVSVLIWSNFSSYLINVSSVFHSPFTLFWSTSSLEVFSLAAKCSTMLTS